MTTKTFTDWRVITSVEGQWRERWATEMWDLFSQAREHGTYKFVVDREEWNDDTSDGLPERTIYEARVEKETGG